MKNMGQRILVKQNEQWAWRRTFLVIQENGLDGIHRYIADCKESNSSSPLSEETWELWLSCTALGISCFYFLFFLFVAVATKGGDNRGEFTGVFSPWGEYTLGLELAGPMDVGTAMGESHPWLWYGSEGGSDTTSLHRQSINAELGGGF